METGKRTYAIILAVLFGLFLCFPMFYDAFDNSEQDEVSETENRNLAPKPFLDITYLDIFPDQYTAYYNDHFPFRQEIMHFFGRNILWGVFNKSPVPDKVAIGKDGWLFQAENQLLYSGQDDFTEEEVGLICLKLHERALYLDSLGIRFYVMFAPMKCEIYHDKLPHYFVRTRGKTRTDKVIERLVQDSLIHFIDLKRALISVSDTSNLYYKTDHHWTTAGGYVVYREIMKHLSGASQEIFTVSETDIVPYTDSSWCGGMATMTGLVPELIEISLHYVVKQPRAIRVKEKNYDPPSWFPYKDEFEIRTRVADTSLPKIVIIRDSFFSTVIPFLSEDYQQTLYIFDGWMFGPNYPIIEQEKPDIVLLEIYEPFLNHIL